MGLLGWLTGRKGPDPAILLGCQDWLDEACNRMNAGEYSEAEAGLRQSLGRITAVHGRQADLCRAALLCCLGECQFHMGATWQALIPLHEAEALVGDDLDLATEVHGNLYETYRYLEYRNRDAADHAEELAALADRRGDVALAGRYRRQAALVLSGEPLVRVVADVGGQRMEMEEVLQGTEGPVRFLVERNRVLLRTADFLLQRGEVHAQEGLFDWAVSDFAQARGRDVWAPQPQSGIGLMALYMDEPVKALRWLARAAELAPGWPRVASLLDLAKRREAGQFPPEVFRQWHAVEEGPLVPELKLRLCEETLEQAPWLPHLHDQRGRLLRERGLGHAAANAFRRALDLEPPPDVETRASVGLAAVIADQAETKRLLERAVHLNADLIAAATARVVLHFG